jgi:hypothetical protein
MRVEILCHHAQFYFYDLIAQPPKHQTGHLVLEISVAEYYQATTWQLFVIALRLRK